MLLKLYEKNNNPQDLQQIVDILNDGIDKVIKNGEAAKISQKWFGKDIVLK